MSALRQICNPFQQLRSSTLFKNGAAIKMDVEDVVNTPPTIVSYETLPASHEGAWDGVVRANVESVTTHQFLWSSGQISAIPELINVRPGTYSVSVIDAEHRCVPYVHATYGAEVGFLTCKQQDETKNLVVTQTNVLESSTSDLR